MSQLDEAKLKTLKEKLNSPAFSKFEQISKRIQDTFGFVEGFSNSFMGLKTSLDKIGELATVDFGTKLDGALSNVALAISKLESGFSLIDTQIDALATHGAGRMKYIQPLVDEILAINNELGKIEALNANVKMSSIGDNMAIKNAQITFQRKPIDVTLNLNVQMDAQQVTKTVIATSRKMSDSGIDVSLSNTTQQRVGIPSSPK